MIDEILIYLERVRKRGQDKYMACCPIHGEKTPSLSLSVTKHGDVLAHCFGCGANGQELVGYLGLSTSVLFAETLTKDTTGKPRYPAVDYPTSKEQLAYDRYFIEIYESDDSKKTLKDKQKYREVKTRYNTFQEKMTDWL